MQDHNQDSNPMASQPSEEQGNSNQAEPTADIDDDFASVGTSFGSSSSQSREISEEEVDGHYYRPLLQAACKGDWESAARFFEQDAASIRAKITSRSETVLHIAALSAQDQFLENLVELLSPYPEVLEMVDCDGRTALHNAALCGRIRMVKALVIRNPQLTQLTDNEERVPLGISANMHKEIAWFLARRTTDDGFNSYSAIDIIMDLTYAGYHEITLYLIWRYPHLATIERVKFSILHALVKMPSQFRSGTRLSVLEALIYKCIPVDLNYRPADRNSDLVLQRLIRSLWNAAKIAVPLIKKVHAMKLRHVAAVELAKLICNAMVKMSSTEITDLFQEWDLLYEATTEGISELVKLFIQFFPELIWISPYGKRLTTYAVEFRQESILRLFLKVSSTNELSLVPWPTQDESMGMMSAIAEDCSSFDGVTNVAGATFQMQRELQWYRVVEKCVIPVLRTSKVDSETYWQKFEKNHKVLLENGKQWVKETSNSCMIVSTLIATVLFAAAFTVPGGNDNNTGVPLLLGQDSLLIFAISDALGLFSSVMAILLFLAILTSRYEAQDFLYSLPNKIIMGLCFLFLSLAFMLVAFAATLINVLAKRLEWVLIPVTLLASVPIVLFVLLQLPLLYQMVKSTYGLSIFHPEGIWDGVKYIEQDQELMNLIFECMRSI